MNTMHKTGTRLLLYCGILSSLLYAAMNIVVAMQDPHYHSNSQTVSELSAIDAPTRSFWILLSVFYTLLTTAFGFGVLYSARNNRALKITGGLIIASFFLNIAWFFAPMHQRPVLAAGGGTLTDTMHLALSGITVLLFVLIIGSGAVAFNKKFLVYSVLTLLILLFFGVLTGIQAPKVSANLYTPYIGIWERINIAAYLLWIAVLAIKLLRSREITGQRFQ